MLQRQYRGSEEAGYSRSAEEPEMANEPDDLTTSDIKTSFK
jgi:hypothetical protein